MQTQGSLRDGGLATLLQTMQSERATGTLAIENAGDSASLYFLFGHLFHASGPGGQGEDVVIRALEWDDGSYQFDPRAKLPAEETIKSSPNELLSAARSRQATATVAEPAGAGVAGSSWLHSNGGDPTVAETVPAEPEGFGASEGEGEGVSEPEPGLASWAASQGEVVTPASEPEPELSPATASAAATTGIDNGSQASRPLGLQQAGVDEVVFPLPSGHPHYENLKSAFVDFPRLLRTLRGDKHTGYIRLQGSGYSGVILLHEGQVLDAVVQDGSVTKGEDAFLRFRRHMDDGDGMLDVIELDGQIVVAAGRLFTAPLLYTGLLGRFVNLDALLEYLNEEKVDGAVVVTGSSETGVILLGQGGILGAYTESRRDLDSSTSGVAKLAGDRASRIEVKSGSGSLSSIDVDSTLNKPY